MNSAAPGTLVAPDLVGMPFHIGRDVADQAGLALAWPGSFYITSQAPAPGEPIRQGDSIAVTVMKHGDEAVAAVNPPSPRPPHLSAHAEAVESRDPATTSEDGTVSTEERPRE